MRNLQSKNIFIIFCLIILLSGCKKNIFTPEYQDFTAKSFVSNIKCYNVNADYVENDIPFDTTSLVKPFVYVQSFVIKGKDILMSVVLPIDADEIFISAKNPVGEYNSLHFEGNEQKTSIGYYRLKLENINNPDTGSNGKRSYLVVLSSNENIQLSKFDLIVSCKASNGISNKSTIPLGVESIAPYQKNLKIGFKPLNGYTYNVTITNPSGQQIIYSYNKAGGNETFNNSQSPNSSLSYDQGLGVKWINLDPKFGPYNLNETIQIDLSAGSQTIYVIIIIVAEGKIDQLTPSANIQQTGPYTAVGTVNIDFKYFLYYEVPGIVPAIKQTFSNGNLATKGCWATCATMLISWKNNKIYTIDEAMLTVGQKWDDLFVNNSGLNASEKVQFLQDANLKAEEPYSPLVLGIYSLLKQYGPLWVTTREQLSLHGRVITGIYGDGTFENTFLHINDPWTGLRSQDESFKTFIDKFIAVYGTNMVQIVHY